MIITQLTPLISFEVKRYDNNFVLRASELKPRITKFIKEEFLNYYDGEKKEEFKKLINNKEIFPNDKGCSYFKLLVEDADIEERYKFKKGSYFGNYDAIELIDEVKIEVVSFLKPLKELVEEAFKYFFVLYNLGARQSKGFGGFIVKGTSKEEFENILKKKYNLIFAKDVNNEFNVLKVILNDYQILKSGRNTPYKNYKKSFLFQYFAKKNIGWEKRKIKESIKNKCSSINIKGLNRHTPNSEFKEYRFIRALLGVASSISFKRIKERPFTVNVSNRNIQKFASPILFKIYKNRVYALPNALPQKIFNQRFSFSVSKKLCNKKIDLITLSTPNDFDLEKFLKEYLVVKLNWREL